MIALPSSEVGELLGPLVICNVRDVSEKLIQAVILEFTDGNLECDDCVRVGNELSVGL